jgi:NAD(P)-dependent dehydrogenase (short-subunit alcohol dehydrogenase family)
MNRPEFEMLSNRWHAVELPMLTLGAGEKTREVPTEWMTTDSTEDIDQQSFQTEGIWYNAFQSLALVAHFLFGIIVIRSNPTEWCLLIRLPMELVNWSSHVSLSSIRLVSWIGIEDVSLAFSHSVRYIPPSEKSTPVTMSSQTIFLGAAILFSPKTSWQIVTGAGRGIGFALVEKLASNPNNIVFAGVRNVNLDAGHALARLVANKADAVQLVEISSAHMDNNTAAAELVMEKYGKIDVIIANAGAYSRVYIDLRWSIGSHSGVQPILTATAEALQSDFTTNTIGPLILFQSFASLLKASKISKFIVISSTAGQIEDSLPYPLNGYGLSKAGANYVAKKIDQEVDFVTSFSIQ